ncbi:hypothetical protein EI94DRAFT_1801124 [Lactarius quietus]|nr:hypothetical protein EI94DRAFT_1801124 [Lactarius quietus]
MALIPRHTAGLAIPITAQASTLNTASVPAALKHNVSIKCATITVDEVYMKEFKLKQMQVLDAFHRQFLSEIAMGS